MDTSATRAHAHDGFVRTVLSDPKLARKFFDIHLPEEIKAVINLDHLSLEPRSYIDGLRTESIVDLLYKTTIKQKTAYLYLLLEHQSTPDVLMPFRLLKYTCNIMDQHLKRTQQKKLPLVYPMVIYHAKHPYPYATDIRDSIAAPRELIDRYFLKPFHLIDLGRIADADLKEHAWVGVMELVLKHIFARDLLPHLQDMAELLQRIVKAGGRDYVSIVLQYVLERGEFSDKPAFFELVNQHVSSEVGENIMTLAEQLRAEGRAEGLSKGKLEGKLEIAKQLLAEGMAIGLVAEITRLSEATLKALWEVDVNA